MPCVRSLRPSTNTLGPTCGIRLERIVLVRSYALPSGMLYYRMAYPVPRNDRLLPHMHITTPHMGKCVFMTCAPLEVMIRVRINMTVGTSDPSCLQHPVHTSVDH